MRVWFLVVLLSACATTRPAGEDATAGNAVTKAAATHARETVKEVYDSLRRGDVDGLHSLVGAQVFAVGPRATDVFGDKSDLLVALSTLGGRKHRVTSRALQVASSPAGRSAWASDEVDIDGARYRVIAILSETDELWAIDAVFVGRVGAKGAGEPVALPGGIGRGAGPVAERYHEAQGAPARFLDQVGPGRDSASKALKKALKKELSPHATLDEQGAPRAELTPDGSLGWIVANAAYTSDGKGPVSHRFFVVYERVSGAWRLVALQHSQGVR